MEGSDSKDDVESLGIAAQDLILFYSVRSFSLSFPSSLLSLLHRPSLDRPFDLPYASIRNTLAFLFSPKDQPHDRPRTDIATLHKQERAVTLQPAWKTRRRFDDLAERFTASLTAGAGEVHRAADLAEALDIWARSWPSCRRAVAVNAGAATGHH